eukprot:CAMPEP_0115006642 /NCGR_PEP_ID=MMETSP0216-20121206/20627_1 /TAXON_ID=223996 /ORGANISM="Protocruzia adherens, Strain Boccale" /LENGTH=99 /DNA_ID=CAMNT_0002373275 /DNA_START=39 /DNA_END=338 /DNA_ORIENTATION=-
MEETATVTTTTAPRRASKIAEASQTKTRSHEGFPVSHSSVKRLEREVKALNAQYDNIRIKHLTAKGDMQTTIHENQMLTELKNAITQKEDLIMQIKLML